jgi:hypothetical protein
VESPLFGYNRCERRYAVSRIVTFTLRLPESLHADLRTLAAIDLRSLHSEMLYLLQQVVEERRAEVEQASKRAA